MSTAERFSTLLRRMLDRVGLVPFRSEVAEDGRVWFVVPNPNESPIEKLDVSMAADGDVEVALHVPGRRGSPFEQLFVWSSDPEYLPCVVEFVADLVEDRCVLAYRSGWFRGGREFVRRERLGDGEDAGFEWIATWSGVPPESVPPTEDRDPLQAHVNAHDIRRLLERVREITGIEDIEWLEDLPPVAHYDDRELHPDRGIRVGPRFFTEMKEYPGDWWMGELDAEGELYVWGVYGDSLEEAVRSH